MTVKKFLIIQTAFIGDVILATSLIEKLHHHFPGAIIDFLVRKGNESLLTGHPHLRQVLAWDKKKNKKKNLWKMLWAIRRERYDRVINVQRFASTGFLTSFSGAGEKIGYDKNPLSFLFTKRVKHRFRANEASIHEIERTADLVKSFTDDQVFKPRLYPLPGDDHRMAAYKQKPYITIAPASVWHTKQYPKLKWIELVNNIPRHYAIYLLGAAADLALAAEIVSGASNSGIVNLCGKLTLLESASLIRDAAMNYANDSAPMHIASAMNAPVTAIYCSTVPRFGYGPVSDRSFIVETRENLECRPCGLHGRNACPLGHFLCAYSIKREQVLEPLLSLT